MTELPEESQAELFLFTHEFLRDHGYPGYEVSNFAKRPAHESRHNRKYWDHTPYLGLGPSAHSLAVSETRPPLVANAWSGDGVVMGLRHQDAPVHGLQFHPESVASKHGHALLGNFLKLAAEARATA